MKDLILKCSCIAKKACGRLRVINYGDKDCEINGIYLDKKDTKKLLEYLKTL